MDILVVAEHKNGTVHRISWEAIAASQSLVKDLGLTAGVVVMGHDITSIVKEITTKNVDEVLVIDDPLLTDYSADGYTQFLKQVIETESPTYVIMGHTYMVRDFFPKVSAAIGKPFLGDNIGYRLETGSPVFIKQVFQGKMLADVIPTGDCPYLITFQSAAFQSDAVEVGSGAPVREIPIDLDESIIKTQSEQPFQEAPTEVDLSSAELIIAVGRGLGKEENLDMIRQLAKAMGAQLAASRPVVDAEWLPSYHQIGSSGQTVAPKLYLAMGISGAIQHVVGMKGSKNIIAINKDPDAPIFELADYGVVGDIHEIAPKLVTAVKSVTD